MPTLDVDGSPLHYLDEGAGLPVLLFHAYPLSAEQFAPQVRALSGRFRFILPDARGFGRSAAPAEGAATEMGRMARDGLAVLDALGVDRAVVGGVSMGGYAALALLREDAGRVAGLVLSDTQAGADDAAGKERREAQAREALAQGLDPVVAAMLPKLVAAAPDSPVGREVERLMRTASPRGVAAALRGMALRTDSKDLLARYAGPALFVVGEKDGVTPVEKARAMADLVAGSTLEVVPGAGHLPNLEAPERFNAVLSAFLSGLAG